MRAFEHFKNEIGFVYWKGKERDGSLVILFWKYHASINTPNSSSRSGNLCGNPLLGNRRKPPGIRFHSCGPCPPSCERSTLGLLVLWCVSPSPHCSKISYVSCLFRLIWKSQNILIHILLLDSTLSGFILNKLIEVTSPILVCFTLSPSAVARRIFHTTSRFR